VLGAVARTATHGQLPFTGLPVWAPILAGLVLIGLGLALRRRSRPSGI
jgi:LPXTG-motif cell wall-anchored protein